MVSSDVEIKIALNCLPVNNKMKKIATDFILLHNWDGNMGFEGGVGPTRGRDNALAEN